MDTRTILLAEDDDNEFLLMDMAFRKLELESQYRRVCNGEEVIRYLEGQGGYSDRERYPFPYLLLLDLKMPVKGGFEVLDWIRSESTFKQLIVAMLTSSHHEDDIARAYNSWTNSYLVKPDTIESLVKMIERIKGYWLELNVGPDFSRREEEPVGVAAKAV